MGVLYPHQFHHRSYSNYSEKKPKAKQSWAKFYHYCFRPIRSKNLRSTSRTSGRRGKRSKWPKVCSTRRTSQNSASSFRGGINKRSWTFELNTSLSTSTKTV